MQFWHKILLILFIGIYFLSFSSVSHAFLWEDLGLNLYEKIDEWFYELKRKQYEYELTGQGEASIADVVRPILADRGINCDVISTQHIEELLWNQGDNQIQAILDACGFTDGKAPTQLIEEVNAGLTYVKNIFTRTAQQKAKATYDVMRIWIYNDGNIENSPFDLIIDLKEIDRVIFSEAFTYDGIESQKSGNDILNDFLEEDKDYLYTELDKEKIQEEEEEDTLKNNVTTDLEDSIEKKSVYHNYVCLPWDTSWLNDGEIENILENIENPGLYTPYVNVWKYPDQFWLDSSPWSGPFSAIPASGTYNSITDSWGCDPSSFFCIVIEMVNSTYGLEWWSSVTIETILAKAGKNLEKPANASLTQHKMQTNNFEIGAIIKDLPGMLRGFWLEVQTKPVPILNLKSEKDSNNNTKESLSEKRLQQYYKNLGLDYERKNNLQIFRKISRTGSFEEEQKVLQTAAGMSIQYLEGRLNELSTFQAALSENNRIISIANNKSISYDDMKKFANQFSELERFTSAMEDFSIGFTDHIKRLKKIPIKTNN